ncbi:hypothetical protein [Nocardioides sp. R-C-SC26]|uniref:hypothetical protein n=1 Tax=Nocardioides sp. R-C-SC26 TaxID=2870414 RepID=UPI0027E21022|nr:hypothetical protein [Nocardioides sp. R-C-SC26]
MRDGASGLLIDSHDPTIWADTLARLAHDPVELDRLAGGALRQAQAFSWDVAARQMIDVYRRARIPTTGALRG